MNDIDLEKIKNINVQDLGASMGRACQRFFKLILVIFWILIMAGGAYFWYLIFYSPGWTEAEKTAFINAKFPENNLKKELVEKVLQKLKAKEEKFNQETFPAKNIFRSH